MSVWGGTDYPWGSPTIIGLAVAGAGLLVVFVLQERRAREPVLPLRLWALPALPQKLLGRLWVRVPTRRVPAIDPRLMSV